MQREKESRKESKEESNTEGSGNGNLKRWKTDIKYIWTQLQCYERDWIFCVTVTECCSDQKYNAILNSEKLTVTKE